MARTLAERVILSALRQPVVTVVKRQGALSQWHQAVCVKEAPWRCAQAR